MTSESLRFKGKVAIVTGGCQGIGKGCIDVFVQNGGKAVIFDINEATGKSLVGKSGTGEIHFIRCDTKSEEQIKSAVKETVKKYGQIDCLVNNAGFRPDPCSIDDLSVEVFNDLIQLNLTGYFMCSKYTLPYLRQTKGSIINISSVAKTGQCQAVNYVASKGGISAMTKAIAFDEAQYGVRVNEISPGCIRTPLYENIMARCGESFANVKFSLLDRIGEAEEIGRAVLFLATEATYCTAMDLTVAAGMDLGGWK